MANLCACCGSPLKGGIGMGGVIVCRSCDPILREAMDAERAAGRSVDCSRLARSIYKAQFVDGDYLLRDIPDELMRSLKHHAVDDGVSVRELILRALWASVKR